MILSHKIELVTTCKQRDHFMRCCGTARFVWNHALAAWNAAYASGEKPTGYGLKKAFNQTKYELYPWLKDVHRDCHSQPFANLQRAFNSFFKGVAKRPKFKKRGKCRDSFAVANDKFRVDGETVVLPKIGRVRMTEPLRFNGKVMGAVVSRTGDRWFIAIQVDVGDYRKDRSSDNATGIDLGIKTAITLADGEKLHSPRPLKKYKAKLKRVSRRVSRRVKGSKNRSKAVKVLARVHAKVARIRNDWLHKITTTICKNHAMVVIEDLNVSGMLANRKLAPAICDMGWFEFRRQLDYKSAIYGTKIVIADRWFPSSKRCSACGSIKQDLTLRERSYECNSCGLIIDRDLNAAMNLRTVGLTGIAHGSFDNPLRSHSERAE